MKNDRLLEALKRKGWSQKELAERTGLTPSAISLYVNGSRLRGQDTIVKLCKALGVSADWLLGIEPERTATCITQSDGCWYHGNGKLGGEFHPTKPNDEERYGEYVKVVRRKDCKHLNKEEMRCFEVEGLGYQNVADDDFCSRGERKGVEE